jgi:hypothetical protein
MVHSNPYSFSSDEVIFTVYTIRNRIPETELDAQRAEFFSKGQPCLRSSPLGKTYGWGIRYDGESRIAIYPRGSEAYARLEADQSLRHLKAMRSSK